LADALERAGNEANSRTEAGGCYRRLRSGVTSTDYEDIEIMFN